MKRSEMIVLLKDSFLEHMNCSCCENDERLYGRVLQEIEDAGMLPPTTNFKFDHPNNDGYFEKYNAWEPEETGTE